ncbi:MAG: D-2-hydroxyacid dehydrogenase [Pseudomonadota bacterium]
MTRILIHTDAATEALGILSQRLPDLSYATCETYEGLADCVATHRPEVVYSCRFSPASFPRAALVEAESVRWISNAGSGVNHLAPWDPARITVTNSAGVAADAMAEFALAAMLHFSTGRPQLARDQATRRWEARTVRTLAGSTLLCVGLGPTGRRMAALGKALGMQVLGIRASGAATPDVDLVETPGALGNALADADYILVCLPLTASSRGMLGPAEFANMKPGAVLVDLSRGGIIDHAAMNSALDDGRLSGAALDVFPTEPLPPDDPLWQRENVMISPHCSGVYDGWERRSVEMFADNLERWLEGQPLSNVVDPEKGY